jgi:hypothetical protein
VLQGFQLHLLIPALSAIPNECISPPYLKLAQLQPKASMSMRSTRHNCWTMQGHMLTHNESKVMAIW